jgi:hypothetical protein
VLMPSRKTLSLLFILLSCAPQLGAATPAPAVAAPWVNLLDEKLTQWDSYLSYRFKPGYDGTKPPEAPIGLNKPEAAQIFTVTRAAGAPLLRISGEIYGAIITKQTYRNYRLKLALRWGEKKWPPREQLLKDSGILYHSVGAYGAEYWRSWMLSQEFQIMEGHMGDYWSQATSAIDVRAYPPEYIMNPVANHTQPFLAVGHKQAVKGLVLRSEDKELPGEWNNLELICYEGKSVHIVNGAVVMVLDNSRYEKNGQFIPLKEGKIQLQSEAAEVFYRAIQIQEITQLPKEYESYFAP